MKLLAKIFHSSVFIMNLVAIIFLILSAFSDYISPEKAVFFSFLGMAFPLILAVNVLFLVWWIIVLKWKYVIVDMIAFMICISAITTYFPLHSKTKKVPDDCVKILTYNVMRFAHAKAHKPNSPNRVLEYIVNSKADIVCLQEYCTYEIDGLLSEKEVKEALKTYPYQHLIRLTPTSEKFGIAIFSKYPIESIHQIPMKSINNGAFLAELNVKGKKVTLLNVHLETNRLSMEDRAQYASVISQEFDSKKLDVMTEKAVKQLKPAFKARAEQSEIIEKELSQHTNPYVIVCGDFNDTPISYARKKIKGNLIDSFAETGFGPGISYNQNKFWFRIDNIFHSKNIKAYNCTVDKIKYSDHYPVWTYLELK